MSAISVYRHICATVQGLIRVQKQTATYIPIEVILRCYEITLRIKKKHYGQKDKWCLDKRKSRIAMSKTTFSRKKSVFTSKLLLNLRKKLAKR
jgi:hypothetical protein